MTTVTAANPVQPGDKSTSTELLPGPSARAQAESRIRSSRAATMAAFTGAPEVPPDEQPPAPRRAASKDETPPPRRDVETDVAADHDDEPAPAAKAAADQVDPETAKRLAKVQDAEKRSREKLTAERAEVEKVRAETAKERAELERERAELAAYRKAKERAKVDPVSVLEALGVTDPTDLDYAAKVVYAKAKADPANKEAAAHMLRERERADELAQLRERLDRFEKTAQERSTVEVAERQAAQYADRIVKTATAGEISPLAKLAMSKNPDRTHDALSRIYGELYKATGDQPDPEDVLAHYEKNRRAELIELGVDPDSLLTTTSKKPDPEAAKKTAAKTLGNDLSTPRVPRPRSSDRESRAETLRDFEAGKLD